MAKALVARQVAYRNSLPIESRADLKFHIAGHSNAGRIMDRMLPLAAAAGLRYETASFIAAANHSDPERGAVAAALADRTLGRAIAWSSPEDGIISPLQRPWKGWGYGSLGARGWERDAWRKKNRQPIGLRVDAREPVADLELKQWGAMRQRLVTRWFEDHGHSQYWQEGEEREASYRCLAQDWGLVG